MKICTICNQNLSYDHFFVNPNTPDKRASQCKICEKLQKKKRSRERKEKLVVLSGGKCLECGYDKCIAALEFHHINDDKEFSIANLTNVDGKFEEALEESKKCILLCANCHREKHFIEYPQIKTKRRRSHWVHGTYHGYQKGCKCKPCRFANTLHMREYKERKKKMVV